MDKRSKIIIGLLAASVITISVLLFIEKKTTSSTVPTQSPSPTPTPTSTPLVPTQSPSPTPTPTPSPTPTPTPSSLPPSTLTSASNVFSYLNGILQVSVNYQYPTYIGYKTRLSNGNQLLLLPVPQGTSSLGNGCATLLDYDLLPYIISMESAPSGGPFCQPMGNTFAIYNGFIVFNLPPPRACVPFSLIGCVPMPDIFAISVQTNKGTLAYVLQDITLPQSILSQLPLNAQYWSSNSSFFRVLGYGGAQDQFITLNNVVSNGQPSAYEYWTVVTYPWQIQPFYPNNSSPPSSLLSTGYFFNLLDLLYIPVSKITQVTGVQAYSETGYVSRNLIGVAYSPNAITQTSTTQNGYTYKYYTYEQLQEIWQQIEARFGNIAGFTTFINYGLNLTNMNTVIVSPRGTLSQLLQWAQQNGLIKGYTALFPGPVFPSSALPGLT